MTKQAKVLLGWQKSISTDVTSQKMVININGEPLIDQELPPSVQEFVVIIPEKKLVNVELKAFDGTHYSEPATLDFEIGDLTFPEPPTNLSYEVLEIFDSEEEVVSHPRGLGQ